MPPFVSQHEQTHLWHTWAEEVQEQDLQRIQASLQALWKGLRPRSGECLLDLGCSQGRLLASAIGLELCTTGVAYSPEEAAMSQKNAPPADVVLGTIQAIPFDSDSFDLLTAFENLSWLEDPLLGLREVSRVLKPGGRAGLLLPNAHYFQKPPEKYAPLALPPHAWSKLLPKAGLRLLKALKTNYPPQSTPGRKPHLRKKRGFLRKLARQWRPAWRVPYYLFFACKE